MKSRLIGLMKRYRWLYALYYYIFSAALKILGLTVRKKTKSILFVCLGGKSFGNNVAPIYKMMKTDERFSDWNFIWAFQSPGKFEFIVSERTSIVKIDTLKFFILALKSRCWITDVSVQRGLNFKNKGTIYINTWHGVPLKKILADAGGGKVFRQMHPEEFDYVFTEGTYDAEIALTAFRINRSQVMVTGYPRNDKMFVNREETIQKIYEKYNIKKDKKIILYAPTYRDYNIRMSGAYQFDLAISPEGLIREIGDEYVLMVRTHSNIDSYKEQNEFFINVSDYPDVEDLMVASYLLISDYSGIIFDYSLLEKPIVCFWYDIDKYETERGFNVDMHSFIPFDKCYTERELCDCINGMNYNHACNIAREFRIKCGLIRDGATKNVVNSIADCLGL